MCLLRYFHDYFPDMCSQSVLSGASERHEVQAGISLSQGVLKTSQSHDSGSSTKTRLLESQNTPLPEVVSFRSREYHLASILVMEEASSSQEYAEFGSEINFVQNFNGDILACWRARSMKQKLQFTAMPCCTAEPATTAVTVCAIFMGCGLWSTTIATMTPMS